MSTQRRDLYLNKPRPGPEQQELPFEPEDACDKARADLRRDLEDPGCQLYILGQYFTLVVTADLKVALAHLDALDGVEADDGEEPQAHGYVDQDRPLCRHTKVNVDLGRGLGVCDYCGAITTDGGATWRT